MEQTARSMSDGIFSDFYKSVYGIRPRQHEYFTASDERRNEIVAQLQIASDEEDAREARRQEKASADFEAEILRNIDLGASDRKTAIKWIVSAELEKMGPMNRMYAAYDAGYFRFLTDLPYSAVPELTEALS